MLSKWWDKSKKAKSLIAQAFRRKMKGVKTDQSKRTISDFDSDSFGIPTVRGYNAPCFDGMVHCFMGSGLMRRDNEDGKDTETATRKMQLFQGTS